MPRNGLQQSGHVVTALTSMPHYFPPDDSGTSRQSRGSWPCCIANEDGVKVVRIYMPRKGRRVWSRLFDFLWFQFMVTALGLWYGRGCRVVLVTSPPFTFGLSGILLGWMHGAAFIYDVRELVGDVLVHAGMLRSRLLIRVSYALEGFVYRRADAISAIAPSFRDRLMARGIPASKIRVAPNFVEVEFIKPGNKDNSFSRRHHLEDAFVVLYAGNLGLTQGLEILVEVARAFKDDPKFVVLVVGEGVARAGLEKAVGESGLTNIRLLPYQPLENVPELYATADVCVSPMRSQLSYSTVPSKIHTAMAAGRAVVAAAEPDSEAARLIRDAEAGICVPPESPLELVSALRQLRTDAGQRSRLGANGRNWSVGHYSRDAAVAAYDRLIRDVAAGQAKAATVSPGPANPLK
jgi:colanic acid biosynthesis glycosyl transferase WcaI